VFYLFFPLICVLLRGRKWLETLLAIFVVLGPFGRTTLAHGNEVWQEYSYLGGMDAIALGCLAAIAGSRIPIGRSAVRVLGSLGAVTVLFILSFSEQTQRWGLARCGLDMSILAIGSCMVSVAAAQSAWRCPRTLSPLTALGRRSYEIYLTHMFVVFALFALFKPVRASLGAVPILFIGVVLLSSVLGACVARFYSEPMNRRVRRRFETQIR
jgi:peptidoglycan/LPS O-acetylase OafA/YrhL